jgi:phosphoenolpyruvate carboxylase
VTHDTTRDVCVLARLEAVNYYFKAVERLMFDLSIWRCTPELKVTREGVLHVRAPGCSRAAAGNGSGGTRGYSNHN